MRNVASTITKAKTLTFPISMLCSARTCRCQHSNPATVWASFLQMSNISRLSIFLYVCFLSQFRKQYANKTRVKIRHEK